VRLAEGGEGDGQDNLCEECKTAIHFRLLSWPREGILCGELWGSLGSLLTHTSLRSLQRVRSRKGREGGGGGGGHDLVG
jgi:hypothetical protein